MDRRPERFQDHAPGFVFFGRNRIEDGDADALVNQGARGTGKGCFELAFAIYLGIIKNGVDQ